MFRCIAVLCLLMAPVLLWPKEKASPYKFEKSTNPSSYKPQYTMHLAARKNSGHLWLKCHQKQMHMWFHFARPLTAYSQFEVNFRFDKRARGFLMFEYDEREELIPGVRLDWVRPKESKSVVATYNTQDTLSFLRRARGRKRLIIQYRNNLNVQNLVFNIRQLGAQVRKLQKQCGFKITETGATRKLPKNVDELKEALKKGKKFTNKELLQILEK